MSKNFDYIIVGGGSAGCVLANRLSANPKTRVCLLEAGGSHRHPLVEMPLGFGFMLPFGIKNWSFETEPQTHLNGRRGYQPRGKTLGGSSSLNAQIYIRGVPEDYDRWEAGGSIGWGWKDVLPYFLRSEGHVSRECHHHSLSGPLTVSPIKSLAELNHVFIAAAKQCNHVENNDFNGDTQEGIGFYEVTQKGVSFLISPKK